MHRSCGALKYRKRALQWSALFIACPLTLCLFILGCQHTQASTCVADRIDETARVAWVYDGDTVKLDDGRKVRLIGMDTPETGRRGEPGQPYSQKASKRLRTLLQQYDNEVLLRAGFERKDRYGRLLAHVYLPDRSSVNERLLREGLATTLVVPPNVWNIDCYQNAENVARNQQLGIWSLPKYRTTRTTDLKNDTLKNDTTGFRIVTGKIERVGRSRKSTWLNLEGGLGLRIDHRDAHYFKKINLKQLAGKHVTARGWLYNHKNSMRMQIRHPAALVIKNPAN